MLLLVFFINIYICIYIFCLYDPIELNKHNFTFVTIIIIWNIINGYFMSIQLLFSRAVIQSCTAYISEDSSDCFFFIEHNFYVDVFRLIFFLHRTRKDLLSMTWKYIYFFPPKKSHPLPLSYKMVSALYDINHSIFHVNETYFWMRALGLINWSEQ